MFRTRIKVKGTVQGVFFRQSTREKALNLGLKGWVANNSDGSVEAEIYGSTEVIRQLIEWCKEGPPSARVHSIEILTDEESLSFPDLPDGFSIR